MAVDMERRDRSFRAFGETLNRGDMPQKWKYLSSGDAPMLTDVEAPMPYVPTSVHHHEQGWDTTVMSEATTAEDHFMANFVRRAAKAVPVRDDFRALEKRITRSWSSERSRPEAIRVSNSLRSERTELTFDPIACQILGRIYDRGHATLDDLDMWIESSEEWVAFSRLQRARLLSDSGSEVSVSREGREFVHRILGEDPTA